MVVSRKGNDNELETGKKMTRKMASMTMMLNAVLSFLGGSHCLWYFTVWGTLDVSRLNKHYLSLMRNKKD